ncbi:sulfotransferase [Sulfitobacter guttiformis]|uniref:Sulfotransferase family protein n=2 Tax=Sulfitobacter guttiformis TaxID=74349 RepID=A0A420DG77_9RHOB|nr:sulfotransferase [Sulfitobacter guttiformis]KIN75410.1 hypothetical protein Z949_40 [Sulfitobacter guttiformis KCTC 32187]RKE92083.1 sulfotransferase family protein [Sulfitobacter guttiformis]
MSPVSLLFVVCGLEHTGTTLISDLFRQVEGIDSGFEGGVLLRSSPNEFRDLQPFATNMLKGWGITQEQLDHCCDADDFDTFYMRLAEASTVINANTNRIFDKTPRYLSELSKVLERCDCPVLVSYKDPRAIVCSDFKRAKTDDFDTWYDSYRGPKLRYMTSCYEQFAMHTGTARVKAIGLENLAMNARNSMEEMFAHVGETFKIEHAIIDSLRYKNVRNKTVSADIVFEYKGILSHRDQDRVLNDFAVCEQWIYK